MRLKYMNIHIREGDFHESSNMRNGICGSDKGSG